MLVAIVVGAVLIVWVVVFTKVETAVMVVRMVLMDVMVKRRGQQDYNLLFDFISPGRGKWGPQKGG